MCRRLTKSNKAVLGIFLLISASCLLAWGVLEVGGDSAYFDKESSSSTNDALDENSSTIPEQQVMRELRLDGGSSITSEQCSFSNPFENNNQLISSASVSIRNVVQAAIRTGIELDGLDFISLNTGLPVPLSRFEYVSQQGYSFIKKYPNETVPIFGDPSWLEKMSKESLRLVLGINSIKKDEVLNKIASGALNNETFYVFDKYKTTLLGFLFAKASWFSVDSIEDIISAGYAPTLSDLAFFTMQDVDLDVVKNMWRHADGDVTAIHKYPPVYESLASIALFHGNFELLKFWLAQNSPINPDPLGISAMTKFLFAKEQGSYLPEEETFIINEIAKSPLSQSDYNLMTNLFIRSLDPDLIDGLMIFSTKRLEESQQRLVLDSVKQIADIVLAPLDSAPIDQTCINHYVINSVEYIFSNLLAQQSEQELSRLSQRLLPPEVSSVMTSIAQSKVEEESEITARISERVKKLREERMSQLTEEDNISIEEILSAAKMNNWNLALQLLEAMDGEKQGALNTLMSIALTTTPKPASLIALIKKGAQVPKGAYMQLLFTNNVETVKALIPYGLNIEDPIVAGGDVIKDVIKFGTPEMLEVFMKNGAFPNLSIEGMDAVDILLERFSLKDNDALFLQHLMQNSVDIEQSHIAFVYQLAKRSPEEYQYIESRYPRLTAFTQQKELQ